MNPDNATSRCLPRGQLSLTRLLPGGSTPVSPDALAFPARVPRKGEALAAIAITYGLAAAALAAVFPAAFSGASALWLALAVPVLVQLEIFAAAMLHALTAPAINGRIWFAVLQVVTLAFAASTLGWPRAVAITAAALSLAEFAAGKITRSPL